jgi:hypothetical protein
MSRCMDGDNTTHADVGRVQIITILVAALWVGDLIVTDMAEKDLEGFVWCAKQCFLLEK